MKKEAMLYEKVGPMLNCHVCNRRCLISPGKRGFCNTRENVEDTLYSLNYAAASSMAIDPIEKKPLFHFYPGTTSFSLGTIGCNFRCLYCQNWNISQAELEDIPTRELPPEEAIQLSKENNCLSISWTYNEPTMWFEYTYDSAILAQKAGIKTVYVTNGYMTQEALELIAPYLDAANVDLKGMSERFYRELCDARLQPVLDNIQTMYDTGIHLEVTNLIIPGYNDSEDDLSALVKFMAEEVGVEVPLHFSRFHPDYQLDQVPSTPVKTLEKAREMAREVGMRYVYIGNVPGHDGENTRCYECGELLIKRNGFEVVDMGLKKNRCPQCGVPIDVVD
ncbi:MAG TPA: AmmeMemoRadiSam system radical SAM enzyme [Methanobacteriaceae archaeon]|jgi:pyruvate formate lyase activating enzyme|nr:AmmeMemoRadiSam system radical SAM enzyme [Methanobacteriaceae archaeon]